MVQHSLKVGKTRVSYFVRRRDQHPGHIGLVFCLLGLLMISACGKAPSYAPLPPGSTVLALGDSITHGTGAGPGQNYPAYLADISGWHIINAGLPGDTAQGALSRHEDLLARHRPAAVIIELGGNDFLRKRQPGEIKADLDRIISRVKASGAQPILVAVPAFSVFRASIGALEDSPIYQALAEEHELILIDNLLADILSDPALRADPIHPNARGYRALAEGLAAALADTGLLEVHHQEAP